MSWIKAFCKICQVEVKYCGNATNIQNHLTRYHPDVLTSEDKPSGPKQKKPKDSLALPASCPRAKTITEAIAAFVCKDLHLYLVVENVGLKRLLKVLEPHFVMVQRKRLTKEINPNMFTSVKHSNQTKMQSAERVTITCEIWTVTSHYIDKWSLMSLGYRQPKFKPATPLVI